MPQLSMQERIDAALALFPEGQEIEMDAYKEALYAAHPETGKETLAKLITSQRLARRLEKVDGKYRVFLKPAV